MCTVLCLTLSHHVTAGRACNADCAPGQCPCSLSPVHLFPLLADAFLFNTFLSVHTPVPFCCRGLTLSWVAFGATGDCAASEGPHNVSAAATPDVTAPPTTSGLSEGQQVRGIAVRCPQWPRPE